MILPGNAVDTDRHAPGAGINLIRSERFHADPDKIHSEGCSAKDALPASETGSRLRHPKREWLSVLYSKTARNQIARVKSLVSDTVWTGMAG